MMSKISTEQTQLADWLKDLPPIARWPLLYAGAALFAYYAPLIVIALMGKWTNMLTSMVNIAVVSGSLIIIGIIGAATRRPYFIATIVAVPFLLYVAQFTIRTERLEDWMHWWPPFFFIPVAVFLNAWLLEKGR